MKKGTIKDNDGYFYPITLANSVFNNNGTFLSEDIVNLSIQKETEKLQAMIDNLEYFQKNALPILQVQTGEDAPAPDPDPDVPTMPSILYLVKNGDSSTGSQYIGTLHTDFFSGGLLKSINNMTYCTFTIEADLTKYRTIYVDYAYKTNTAGLIYFGVFGSTSYMFNSSYSSSFMAPQKYTIHSTTNPTTTRTSFSLSCSFNASTKYIGLFLYKEDKATDQQVRIYNLYLA